MRKSGRKTTGDHQTQKMSFWGEGSRRKSKHLHHLYSLDHRVIPGKRIHAGLIPPWSFFSFVPCATSTTSQLPLILGLKVQLYLPGAFYSTLNLRRLIADDVDDRIVSRTLGEHRDRFRALLKKRKVLKNVTSASPLMVCDHVAETVSRELTYCFT